MAYISFQPSDYFETTLHTGTNGSGRTFTGLGFQPDFIWGKVRNSANYNHMFVDSSRGGDKFLAQTSASEDTKSHGEITAWNSDGTTWADGTNATYSRLYYNDDGTQLGGSSYVWWQWKCNGGTTSSNTDGSITSTVQANTTAGFSIVTYTGNATAGATVGHGLGTTPALIILKSRSSADDWMVGHKDYVGNGAENLQLSSTSALATADDQQGSTWYRTPFTSTVFTLGDGQAGDWTGRTNGSGKSIIGYCFAEIKGYSKFGSYTGNGSTDGPFIYTGFRPAFVMIKVISTTENWVIRDNKRDPYNNVYHQLLANATSAEDTSNDGRFNQDFLSNGFKIRATHATTNQSGATYIYMAFAEHPLVGSNGVPATAR